MRLKTLEESLERPMTPNQRNVYLVIDEWWKMFGFGPSIDDIMRNTGDKGRGNVARICQCLVDIGVCKRVKGRARSIRPSYMRVREIE
jgi:SOS-response transcriptional repressor LexA